jgi:hypothetical protein
MIDGVIVRVIKEMVDKINVNMSENAANKVLSLLNKEIKRLIDERGGDSK